VTEFTKKRQNIDLWRKSDMLTLKKRTDFLRARSGKKWRTGTLTLQAYSHNHIRKKSPPSDGIEDRVENRNLPRFGFTVTKRVGSSVVRNRVKRRIKEAVRLRGINYCRAGFDYVVIARRHALICPFKEIQKDLQTALKRIHGRN